MGGGVPERGGGGPAAGSGETAFGRKSIPTEAVPRLLNEGALLRAAEHRNVVKCYGCFLWDAQFPFTKPCVLRELMDFRLSGLLQAAADDDNGVAVCAGGSGGWQARWRCRWQCSECGRLARFRARSRRRLDIAEQVSDGTPPAPIRRVLGSTDGNH